MNEQGKLIDLTGLLVELGRLKRWLFGIPLAATVMVLVISLVLPDRYTAVTTLMPPGKSGSGGLGALAAGLAGGGLLDLSGLAGAGGKNSELYMGILQSRSVRDPLIDKFDLMARYGVALREQAYGRLQKNVSVGVDKKSGLLRIEVDDADPNVAAAMANAHVEILNDVLSRVAVTEAQQKRAFFEKQFQAAKVALSNAEVNLKKTQQSTGVLEIKAQATVAVEAAAALRAQIAQREVQLSAMRSYATAENSDYRRVLAELQGLRSELSKLERRNATEPGLVSPATLPEQGLEYIRAYREVKYQEAIFETMAKQFELAKLEEARDGGELQQLDFAVPPEKRSSPKRLVMVLVTLFVSMVVSVLLLIMKICFAHQGVFEEPSRRKALLDAWRLKG